MKARTIAIDFDGICVTHDFPNVGRSIGAEGVLRALAANGHKLILFTMRCDDSKHGSVLTEAVNWFAANEIPLYGVQVNPTQKHWTSSNKCYAEYYIDAAAIGCPTTQVFNGEITERPFVDWVKMVELLKEKGLL